MKTIMDHLEKTMHSFPDNIAVSDEEYAYSYSELVRRSKSVGTAVAALKFRRRAVAVYMNKTPGCAAAMLGAAYSGNFYVPVDPSLPEDRIKKMLDGAGIKYSVSDKGGVQRGGAANDFHIAVKRRDYKKALKLFKF